MPAGPPRDPLSERYDRRVRGLLIFAAKSRPATVRVFIASPGREFSNTDRGGRTAHERAFTRSVYYLAWRAPINAGRVPDWSVKLIWGPIEQRSGRYGRQVGVRMYTRAQGRRHVARGGSPSWAAGGFRSERGNRIDATG